MKQHSSSTTTTVLVPGSVFLQLGIALAQMDLGALRPGDWLNLCEDFTNAMGETIFVAASGQCLAAYPTEHPTYPLPAEYEVRHFEALQRNTLPLLRQVASQTESLGAFADVGITIYPHGLRTATPGHNLTLFSGPTDACYLALFLALWGQEPPDRILACPECGTLFYRVKQQAYCSRVCTNRVTSRTFRARHEKAPRAKRTTIV